MTFFSLFLGVQAAPEVGPTNYETLCIGFCFAIDLILHVASYVVSILFIVSVDHGGKRFWQSQGASSRRQVNNLLDLVSEAFAPTVLCKIIGNTLYIGRLQMKIPVEIANTCSKTFKVYCTRCSTLGIYRINFNFRQGANFQMSQSTIPAENEVGLLISKLPTWGCASRILCIWIRVDEDAELVLHDS